MSDSPYPGLNPFREEDSNRFFGRDSESAIILANLTAAPLTLLYGPSGVGKSSVLNAGVICRMRDAAAAEKDNADVPGTTVVVFRAWQADPVCGLLAAIHEQVGGDPPKGGLREYLRACVARSDRDFYIVLDQFEEYFLYQATSDAHARFAAEFAGAVNASGCRANFLISIREDALAKLDVFKGRLLNLFDNYLRIEHLTEAGANAAIEGPLSRVPKAPKGTAYPMKIESGLAAEIIRDLGSGVDWEVVGRGVVSGGAEQRRVEAPYLQLVLRRLWDHEREAGSKIMRLATLHELGGCAAIVKRHLDRVLDAFSNEELSTAAALFHYLVTPGGAKIAHTVPDLCVYVDIAQPEVEAVLRKLAGARILREVPATMGRQLTRYEIYHDALAPAVLDWRRRQQNQKVLEAQRITVAALHDAVTSGLTGKDSPEEMTSFIKEQFEKAGAVSTVRLEPGALSGRSLLWVDDIPDNNLYEFELFRHAGMRVVTATSTKEAKARLKSAKFDVLISDIHRKEDGINKPGAGYELLKWVRASGRRLPFLFYTSNVQYVDTKRSQGALGAADNAGRLTDLVMEAVRSEDVQKGRWGGRPARNYRRLSAVVKQVGREAFRVVMTVKETRGETLAEGDVDPGPFAGDVQFHLHQTFPERVQVRKVRHGVARCDVAAYGAFTVGALADQGRTQLELDLALDESFPKEFRDH